jgi:hypothetical protein
VNEDEEEMEIDTQARVIVKDRYRKNFSKVTNFSLPLKVWFF